MRQLESTSGSKVDLHLFSIMSLAILKFQCEYGIPLVFYGCYLNFESSRWPMTLTPANNNKLLNWADLPLQICILFQYISQNSDSCLRVTSSKLYQQNDLNINSINMRNTGGCLPAIQMFFFVLFSTTHTSLTVFFWLMHEKNLVS